MRTFLGVFGGADHESGDRFALRLSRPGALDQFEVKSPIFEVDQLFFAPDSLEAPDSH